MLAHKIRKFSSDTRFVVHIFKKLLEKIVIILRNNLVNIDKFDTFAPDIAENYVLQQHEQQKLRILYRSSAWGKLLLPCALLIAVILMVGVSYLINLMF